MDYSLLLVMPVLGLPPSVTVPMGMNVRLSEATDGVFELRPMFSHVRCHHSHWGEKDRCGTMKALRATVGLAWTPVPGARGGGFFLQPKLSGMVTHHAAGGTELPGAPGGRRTETGGQVSAGFDVGYRKTASGSRSFLAPVLGVGVGYSLNQQRNRVDPGFFFARQQGDGWKDQFIVDVNLDILRFGATFN